MKYGIYFLYKNLFLKNVIYVVCPESIKPINIKKKVTYLE